MKKDKLAERKRNRKNGNADGGKAFLHKTAGKVFFSVCMFSAALFYGGCSLAVADAGTETENDRLIGAFITQEYLELSDMDAFIKDHASQIADGKSFSHTELSGYQQKLYASVDQHGSEMPSDWTVAFPGTAGISFFAPLWTDGNGESYRGSEFDQRICEVDYAVNESDAEETLQLTGTIYKFPDLKTGRNLHFYVNPVYQTADGEIYLVSGSGYHSQTGADFSEGEQMTATLTDEKKQTVDGKAKTEETAVSVKFAVMYRPVEITVSQMDEDHKVLKKQIYQPQDVPEKLRTQAGTAYILTETEKEGPSGKKVVFREVFDNREGEESIFESFYEAEDGGIFQRNTEIEWRNDSD